VDAADDAAAVSRLDQQVLGADTDGLGPGRQRELRNARCRKEIAFRRRKAASPGCRACC
jgi:hypothetical protein